MYLIGTAAVSRFLFKNIHPLFHSVCYIRLRSARGNTFLRYHRLFDLFDLRILACNPRYYIDPDVKVREEVNPEFIYVFIDGTAVEKNSCGLIICILFSIYSLCDK